MIQKVFKIQLQIFRNLRSTLYDCDQVVTARVLTQSCQVGLHQKLTLLQSGVVGSIVMIEHQGYGDFFSDTEEPFSQSPENFSVLVIFEGNLEVQTPC